jgi:HlyD family secretion protein
VAERDGLEAIGIPPGLDRADPETQLVLAGEERLFRGNRVHRRSQQQQLALQIAQIGEEIRGLEAQRQAKDEEAALVETEHAKLRGLAAKGLVESVRVYAVERERTRLLGERGEVDASIARAKTRTSEIRLQIIAIDETARTEAQRELSAVETRLSELADRRMAIEDRLARTDIRAPIAGRVNELNIHTVGGVVTPAAVLVTLVPDDAKLKVEVKLDPASIDQVGVGRSARLRFTAFNQRTTPEVTGTLVHVSPATTRDPATGLSHYIGHVEIAEEELAGLPDRLVPGMPVEVFLTTQERTALSYLAKPLTDQFNRAFRER